VVLLIIAITKFAVGAWVPIVVIPILIMLFKGLNNHYGRVRKALRVPADWRPRQLDHTVVVLVGGVHRGVLDTLGYARSLNPHRLFALSVIKDAEEQERIEADWQRWNIDVPIEFVFSPYRDLTRPILRHLDSIDARWENDIITVVIPEFVVTRWWEHFVHNQSALLLKGRLLFRKGTVVTSVPYHVK
jgi:hypothetical protein